MAKTKSFNLFAGIFIVLIMGLVLAGNIDTIYFEDADTGNPITGVEYLLYTCPDENCDSVNSLIFNLNSGSNNYVTYEYPSTATQSYGAYMFKQCYLPHEDGYTNWGDGGTYDWTYELEKQPNCHAPIDSFSVTNTNYANEPVVINVAAALEADVYSAFTNLELGYTPSGFEDYYSVETLVTVEIVDGSNNVVYTDTETLNLFMDTSQNVQFSWTPTTQGDYTARVTSDVTDCQCSSTIQQYSEKEFTVWAARPQNECYTILNDLVATPQFSEAGDLITITFNKLSNYADNSYVKTAMPTRVTYEIENSVGSDVYTDSVLLNSNSDTINTRPIAFQWTPSESDSYSIRVTGVAESATCNGLTNPTETLTLGYFVDAVPLTNYDVTFSITDDDSSLPIEGATIDFGIRTGTTNNAGILIFNVPEGTYDWDVSATDYTSETGTNTINSDLTLNIELDPIATPNPDETVTFAVTDSQTSNPILGAQVDFDTQIGFTDAQGEVVFQIAEGTYDWTVSATDYTSETGTDTISTSTVIFVRMDPIVIPSITTIDLLYPTGGEDLSGVIDILWDATNDQGHILSVIIEYSLDGGLTWIIIAQDEINDGIYSWDTSTAPDADNYLLRVGVIDTVTLELFYATTGNYFVIDNIPDGGTKSSRSRDKEDPSFCEPLWQCGDWGECVDNVKTRECVDMNRCSSEFYYDRPIERVGCSEGVSNLSKIKLGEEVEKKLAFLIFISLALLIIFLYLIFLLKRRKE